MCVTQTAKKHNLKDENNSYLRATGEDPHVNDLICFQRSFKD